MVRDAGRFRLKQGGNFTPPTVEGRMKRLRSYLSPRKKKKQEEEKPMFTVMPAYPPPFMGGYPPQTPIQYVMNPNSQSQASDMETFMRVQKFISELEKEKKDKEKKPDSKKGAELNANAIFMWMVILLPFVGPLSWWFTAWAFSSGVQMVVEASKMLPK
jgi:hypothetical protein